MSAASPRTGPSPAAPAGRWTPAPRPARPGRSSGTAPAHRRWQPGRPPATRRAGKDHAQTPIRSRGEASRALARTADDLAKTRRKFSQRGVFVDAGGAVGAVAVAEGDLAQQEVLFELGPFFAAGGAQLRVLALLAAAF